MATSYKNLSHYATDNLPDVSGKTFALLVSEWNEAITHALADAARATLGRHGVPDHHILTHAVPGSFELPLAAQKMASQEAVHAVICLGCVIQGETPHFDYVCQAVALGLKDVGLKYDKPVVFGVLTTSNLEQAKDRAGGRHGNKGDEAAITAIKMLAF